MRSASAPAWARPSSSGSPEPPARRCRAWPNSFAVTTPAIRRYLALLAGERGYSPRTIASYGIDLAALASLAGVDAGREGRPGGGDDAAEPRWDALGQHDLRRWIAASAREGLSARTIARRLS
ncbi:MAG: hypothetical protein DCC72_00005, partial [Burkholderiales bacterium]